MPRDISPLAQSRAVTRRCSPSRSLHGGEDSGGDELCLGHTLAAAPRALSYPAVAHAVPCARHATHPQRRATYVDRATICVEQ